jgi:hypothetical protein
MNDDSNIPLLEDIIYRGQSNSSKEPASLSSDESTGLEIESDDFEIQPVTKKELTVDTVAEEKDFNELLDIKTLHEERYHETEISGQQFNPEPGIQESHINEEIRQILDKHMKEAYNEIIRLISHKIR